MTSRARFAATTDPSRTEFESRSVPTVPQVRGINKVGSTWHAVSGVPSGSFGVQTDWAIDVLTGNAYEKTGHSTWTMRYNYGVVSGLDEVKDRALNTRASITTTNVPAPVLFIRTAGYTTVGDGGGALYKRISTPVPVQAWHVQSQDGAWWQLAEKIINPLMFGALGNDAADDTAALVAWIAATAALGGSAHLPTGTYRISAGLSITAGMKIYGDGFWSIIRLMTATQNGFAINTDYAVHISGLYLTIGVTKTDGAGIYVTAPTSNTGSTFKNLLIAGQFIGIDFVRAHIWSVSDNCNISDSVLIGIRIQNTWNGDAGDSVIMGCVIATSGSTVAAINYLSSGGLKLIGNKILGHQYGVLFQLADGVSTSIFKIVGNSIESQSQACISLDHVGATGLMSLVSIVGNEFAGAPISIKVGGTRAWLFGLSIVGNTILLPAGAPGGGTGISLDRGNNVSISGATITGQGVGIGIAAGANVAGLTIGPCQISGFATNISDASPDSNVFTRRLNGTASASTSIAYGALYATTVQTVTFSSAFPSAPRVRALVSNGGTGGGASIIIQSVSTVGFQWYAVGVTNGGSVSMVWDAEGPP